jgi:hypothetical protein
VAKWRDLYTKYNPMNANKPASIADIAFETGVIAERERIIKLLDEALVWAIGNPGDEPWSPTQTIKFAKQLINQEIETVILQEENK